MLLQRRWLLTSLTLCMPAHGDPVCHECGAACTASTCRQRGTSQALHVTLCTPRTCPACRRLVPKQPAKLKAAREAIQSNHLFFKSMLGSFDDDGRTPEHLSVANAAASEWGQAHPEVHPGDIEKVRWAQLLGGKLLANHMCGRSFEHVDCVADAVAGKR